MQATILNKKWRLNYLYKIVNKDWEVVTFKPNFAQQKLRKTKLEQLKRKGKIWLIILKARQLWISTFELIDWLDDALTKRNQTIIITAHKQDKQMEMFQKVKFAYEQLPEEIEDPQVPWWIRKKPKPKYDSKTEYYFPDTNSFIRVALDSRSGTPTRLHLTELAFRDDAKDMMTGTLPSLPKKAPITIETTANWAWGYFFDLRNKYYWRNDWEFECLFIPRYTDAEYTLSVDKDVPEELEYLKTLIREDTGEKLTKEQIDWYVNEYDKHGREVFQEYPSTAQEAFLTSGDCVFNVHVLRATPTLEYEKDRLYDWLRIYKKKANYSLFWVDTAEWWPNGDHSCIVVREKNTLELLACFYDRYPPDALCNVIDYLRWIYKKWIIGVERNNTWLVTISTALNNPLNNWEAYPRAKNLYKMPVLDELTKKQTSKIWRHTNGKSRPYMIWDFEKAVRLWEIVEFDERQKMEMFTFVYNEQKKPEAMEWCHDDAVMADAICNQMKYAPEFITKSTHKKKRRKILDPVTMEYKYV